MSIKLELQGVTCYQGNFPVLRKINLTIGKGEVAVIGGNSGQGKTTLLETCAGLVMPSSGKVLWDGIDINSYKYDELLKQRQRIGFVFQIPALITNFTIFENIALPLRALKRYTEDEVYSRVRSRMEELGLFNIESRYPETLSSVQLKTVAVARALICEPQMLLLDEPLSGIDMQNAAGILNVILDYHKRHGSTVVLTSHTADVWPENSAKFSIQSGKIQEAGASLETINISKTQADTYAK